MLLALGLPNPVPYNTVAARCFNRSATYANVSELLRRVASRLETAVTAEVVSARRAVGTTAAGKVSELC
jgi:hypothetical protein